MEPKIVKVKLVRTVPSGRGAPDKEQTCVIEINEPDIRSNMTVVSDDCDLYDWRDN